MVNGKEEPVGNFRIEIPGIFIGRGDNPKLGKIKRELFLRILQLILEKNQKYQKYRNNIKAISGVMLFMTKIVNGLHHGETI